jgi:hypothetical protein
MFPAAHRVSATRAQPRRRRQTIAGTTLNVPNSKGWPPCQALFSRARHMVQRASSLRPGIDPGNRRP